MAQDCGLLAVHDRRYAVAGAPPHLYRSLAFGSDNEVAVPDERFTSTLGLLLYPAQRSAQDRAILEITGHEVVGRAGAQMRDSVEFDTGEVDERGSMPRH
jgi:hypothetical protein